MVATACAKVSKPPVKPHKTVSDPDAYRGDMVDALFNTVRRCMKSINVITDNRNMMRLHEQAPPGTAGAALFLQVPNQEQQEPPPALQYGVVSDDHTAYYAELGIDMSDFQETYGLAGASQDEEGEGDTDVCYLQDMSAEPSLDFAGSTQPTITRMLNLNVFSV